MTRKKPLVEDARKGLDALRRQVAQELDPEPESYRQKFRALARRFAAGQIKDPAPDPTPPPDR